MLFEYRIIGGKILIQKNIFIKETLVKNSPVRKLLNYKTAKDFTLKHPKLGENGENDYITIDFSDSAEVDLGGDPSEILGALKEKYREKIKGRIGCRSLYTTFNVATFFELDMNTENGEIIRIN